MLLHGLNVRMLSSLTVDICALDPGVTTGLATATDDHYTSFELKAGDYPHPHEMLFDTLSNLEPKKIIYESFQFRQAQLGAVFKGVEYIGVIELYAQLKCIEVIIQSPSDGKAFWDDKKLRALGVYKPGKPHANDAIRHLLTYRGKQDPEFLDFALRILKEKL